jgi:hypothetical protein
MVINFPARTRAGLLFSYIWAGNRIFFPVKDRPVLPFRLTGAAGESGDFICDIRPIVACLRGPLFAAADRGVLVPGQEDVRGSSLQIFDQMSYL